MTAPASNREVMADFLNLFLEKREIRAAFEKHMSVDYIQHSVGIDSGRENGIVALEAMFARMQKVDIMVRHVLVDDDLAAVHIRGTSASGAYDVVDLFRLENGKIAEHWDVFAPVRTYGGPVI